jgi:hypothetical protein
MRHRFPPPFAQPVRGQHEGDRFPRGSLLLCVCRQRAFGYVSWLDLDRRFPATARSGAQRLDGKEIALRVSLTDAGVRDLPARATVPIPERQFVVHYSDGNHQNVGRTQRASRTPYRNTDDDNHLSGADNDSVDMAAQLRNAAAVVR